MLTIRRSPFPIWVFLLALALLIINDLYLKQAYHNSLTGKLSDFAGLLVFSWFWALCFPSKGKLIYIGTAFFFVFWKSSFSQPLFDEIGEVVGYTFTRTVDYSDLVALIVLPFSHRLFRHSRSLLTYLDKPIKYTVSAVCLFAFVATSAPKISVQPEFQFTPSYTINCSKNLLLTKKMTARNSQITTAALLQLEDFSVETSGFPFSYNFDVKIIPLDSSKTTFTVLKMKRYERQGTQKQRDALSEQQLLLQFERDVINELNNFDTTRIFSSFGYRELIK